MQVSVHELKNNLSEYLHQVLEGAVLIVTSHKKNIARILPFEESRSPLQNLLDTQQVSWNGKKPKGSNIKNPSQKLVSQKILEDRQ